ncbi:hypothetical protein [Azospirillum sp. TSO22-1]|uniref:hypothetical protein n=1 Tax=Azospirillum sp. TSO22-1 TaxID=716789 RepID=UPI0011B82FA0|nr:hypothetical protein [Azospirillum sp. TSO22-1]
MRDLRLFLLSLLAAVALTACGPMIETRYAYTPPSGGNGMACIQQCEAGRFQCVREARYSVDACKADAHRRAERSYNRYLSTLRRGEKPQYSLSYFDNSSSCQSSEAQCKVDYNDCYAACGGQVAATRICTSGCEQLKPPLPPGAQVGPTLVNGVPVRTPAPVRTASAAPRPAKAMPDLAPSPPMSGRLAQRYRVRGTNGDDITYDGTVTLRPDGDRYRMRWDIDGVIYNGVGTLTGNRLVIEGRNDGEPFRYDLRVAPDGTVSGRWTGDEGEGTEDWSPS